MIAPKSTVAESFI